MKNTVLISFLALLVCGSIYAQKTPFTVSDAINIKSLGSQTLSDDGRYLAGIIADTRARFGTDHFRFRDPSYLNVRAGELVIYDTKEGTKMNVFDEKVRVNNLTWWPGNDRLIFFEQKNDKMVLAYYDISDKKVRYVKIKDDRVIAANFGINYSAMGDKLVIGMRKKGWMDKAMADYKEATEGPIVVYDGSKDFLKWDKIGLNSSMVEVVMLDPTNGKVTNVLEEGPYGGLRVSENGRYLSYNEAFRTKTSYTRRDGAEYQASFIDLSTLDSATIIYKRNEKRRNFWWDASGMNYAYVDSGNVYVNNIGNYNAEAKNLTKDLAFEDDEKKKAVKFSMMRWHSGGNTLLLSSKKGWWTINADGSDLKLIFELPEDKEEKEALPNRNVVKWSKDGNYLYVSYSDKEKWNRGIQRYNIGSGEFEDLMTDSSFYTSWRFAKNSDKVTYNFSDGDHPNEVYLNNLEFESPKRLTNLNDWVMNKKWTKSELITYRNVDGKELKGILYYPVDYDPNKKYPLVVEVYERFFNNGYRSSMNLIANQGYFGLRPSVDLEQGYPGEAWMKGVTSAVNKLVEEGKVDNDKVGIHGTSYGGYATSLIITQTDRFAAAINISGKVNIISFLGDSPKIGTRNYAAAEVGQDRIGGQFWDEPLKYFQTTAVLYADRIKTPHLLLTGEGDWNVPGTNTREMYYAMRRLGKDVTWVNYMNGGHGAGWASDENDYHDQWNRMFEFYKKYFFPEDKEEKDKDVETDQKH